MENSTIVALVSLLVTGVISVTHILAPIIEERSKRKSQEEKENRDKIDKTAENLLNHLIGFKNDDLLEYRTTEEERIINFLSSFYSWQRAVSPHLDQPDNLSINNLQEVFEKHHLPVYLQENYCVMSSMIITITHSALSRR